MQALLAEATAVHVQQLDRLRAEAVAVVGEREDNSAPSGVEEPIFVPYIKIGASLDTLPAHLFVMYGEPHS